MYLNGINVKKYGARVQRSYKYTPPTISSEYFKGRKRSMFTLLTSYYDVGQLSLPMVFEGDCKESVELQKSNFDGDAFGKCDIDMEDGFSYFCFLDSIGDAEYPSDQLIECEYTFKCIRHKQYKEVEGNTVFCESTLPYTDCVLAVTVGETGTNYQMGPVTFLNVVQGQQLVVDGIKKIITVNGVPSADEAVWINFPLLDRGENTLQCDDTMTIGYYPVYF